MHHARVRSVVNAAAFGLLLSASLLAQVPTPTLTLARGFFLNDTVSPNAAAVTAGGSDFSLVLTGTNFVRGVTVNWIPTSGSCPVTSCAFPSTLLGSTQIRVDLPAALIASPDATAKVTASNANGSPSSPIAFPVNPPITPSSSLPAGNVGSPYSATLFTGGTAPFNAFIEVGPLPPGLSIATSGTVLSGTPTTQGSYPVLLFYGDAWSSGSVSANYTILIAGAVLTFSPATLPGAQVGVAYSQALTASGGVAPYTFLRGEVGVLPPGLTLSQGGTISGTPTSPGTYTFSVLVYDTQGGLGSGSRSITVIPAGISISPATLPGGQLLLNYSASIAATGGTAPYTFTLVSGTLPSGLSLASSGALSGVPTVVGTYSFVVRATDTAQQTANASYSITVGATNGTLFFTPASPPNATVGVPYAQDLSGGGGSPPYTFSIASGVLPQGLTLSPAGALRGTPQLTGVYTVVIQVADAKGAAGTALVSITVAAGLQIVTTSVPPFFPLQPYFAQLTAAGGQPPYIWLVQSGTLPSGLVLNAGSGLISGTPDGDGTTVTIAVKDSQGTIATRTFDIPAGVRPPQLASTDLPAANVGTPYNYVLIATGGSGALTWVLDSGTLPPGLLLSPLGAISGTPTAAGDYPFVLRVFDSGGRFTVSPVHLLVNPPLLSIAGGPLGSVPVGPVSLTLKATGGTAPYTWVATGGTLPPGLSLSPDGVLSGIATTPGSYDFRVTVTDGRKSSASAGFTLVVTVPPLAVAVQSLPSGAVGVAYSASLAASGGTPPYRWSATGLPPGLAIAAGAAAIAGTPSADGSYRVALQVTDSTGASASATLSLSVSPPPLAITTRAVSAATAGQPYSFTFTATGGVPPYNWLVSGVAPAGLRMSGDGVLSGTPSDPGPASFGVIVADARGATARQDVTLEVRVQPLTISTQGLPGGTVGQRYAQTLAAAGGIPPYAWSGTVPPGLSLDPSTGTVSGTPSAAGTGSFSLTVTDSAGASASASFRVNFGLPPLPPVALTGPPATANPQQQASLQLGVGSAFPVPITGTITLTFRGDTGADDAGIQLSTGGRSVSFTIAANSTQAVFTVPNPGVQMGTTAGVITLTARLLAGGVDVTPNPPPSIQVRVTPGPPVITSVRATRTGNTLEVQVTGYSSTREMTQAQFHFAAAGGAQLQTTDLTVPLDSLFSTWYGSAASIATGSQFTYTQQFTVQGPAAVQSVTVTVTNRQGSSQQATATVQ